MTKHANTQPILILGGTGKTGRRIAEQLTERGLPVRIGSRSGTPSFDWNDRASWHGALEGTRAVYISYYPDLAVPGAPEAVEAFAEVALAQGVSRLVLLSGRGEEEAQRAEKVIKRSGADWTILRASWFAQNFSENFLLDAVLSGTVALPVGDVGEPFIDADDIADAAVAALTEDGHSHRLYELTGPRLLTFADAVGEISRASGRAIEFVQVPAEDYAGALEQMQVPADVAELVMYLFTTVLDGRNAYLADGVEQALGRRPRDFTDYAKATAGTGIWRTAA